MSSNVVKSADDVKADKIDNLFLIINVEAFILLLAANESPEGLEIIPMS